MMEHSSNAHNTPQIADKHHTGNKEPAPRYVVVYKPRIKLQLRHMQGNQQAFTEHVYIRGSVASYFVSGIMLFPLSVS